MSKEQQTVKKVGFTFFFLFSFFFFLVCRRRSSSHNLHYTEKEYKKTTNNNDEGKKKKEGKKQQKRAKGTGIHTTRRVKNYCIKGVHIQQKQHVWRDSPSITPISILAFFLVQLNNGQAQQRKPTFFEQASKKIMNPVKNEKVWIEQKKFKKKFTKRTKSNKPSNNFCCTSIC